MSCQRHPHLGLCGCQGLLEELNEGHENPRSTEAALEAVMRPERLLKRVQFPVTRKALDGHQGAPISLDCEQQAGAYRPTVEQHGTGTAHTMLAPDVRARQSEVVT